MWSHRPLTKYCCLQKEGSLTREGAESFKHRSPLTTKAKLWHSRFISQTTSSKRFHYGKQPSTVTKLVRIYPYWITRLTWWRWGSVLVENMGVGWGAPQAIEARPSAGRTLEWATGRKKKRGHAWHKAFLCHMPTGQRCCPSGCGQSSPTQSRSWSKMKTCRGCRRKCTAF